MPIKIPEGLPAAQVLENENIFVMTENRAVKQDIRPLKIAVLNLMPTKIITETQLTRLLSNSPLQVEITLLQTASHAPKHTSAEHMEAFYKCFEDVKDEKFDGLIITGAPVEELPFEGVDYWPELCQVMQWSKTHVFSTLHICWAAQAALYYHYGIPKYKLDKKLFGVYEHTVHNLKHPLMRGFDEVFLAPHSRHTEVRISDIEQEGKLEILATSDDAGAFVVAAKDKNMFFVTGHAEYDNDTLSREYFRDLDKGLQIDIPKNYFPENNPKKRPPNKWRGHAHLLFSNWLNYFVYQLTPYDVNEIK